MYGSKLVGLPHHFLAGGVLLTCLAYKSPFNIKRRGWLQRGREKKEKSWKFLGVETRGNQNCFGVKRKKKIGQKIWEWEEKKEGSKTGKGKRVRRVLEVLLFWLKKIERAGRKK